MAEIHILTVGLVTHLYKLEIHITFESLEEFLNLSIHFPVLIIASKLTTENVSIIKKKPTLFQHCFLISNLGRIDIVLG